MDYLPQPIGELQVLDNRRKTTATFGQNASVIIEQNTRLVPLKKEVWHPHFYIKKKVWHPFFLKRFAGLSFLDQHRCEVLEMLIETEQAKECLTKKEIETIDALKRYICPRDSILRQGAKSEGARINIRRLSQLTGIQYKMLRQRIRKLCINGVILYGHIGYYGNTKFDDSIELIMINPRIFVNSENKNNSIFRDSGWGEY